MEKEGNREVRQYNITRQVFIRMHIPLLARSSVGLRGGRETRGHKKLKSVPRRVYAYTTQRARRVRTAGRKANWKRRLSLSLPLAALYTEARAPRRATSREYKWQLTELPGQTQQRVADGKNVEKRRAGVRRYSNEIFRRALFLRELRCAAAVAPASANPICGFPAMHAGTREGVVYVTGRAKNRPSGNAIPGQGRRRGK